ncbi:HAD family hydrolase [Aliikangiella sp. IMCC44632]
MSQLIRAQYSFVIFDWDGTLMDSTGRIVSAMQTSAKLTGLPIPTKEAVKSIIGLSMQAVMQTLFPGCDATTNEKFLDIYRHQYITGDTTPSPLFDGVLENLNWLKQQSISIAVATGKARAGLNRVLAEVDLLDFFDITICADEAQSKPHPEMVEHLMQRMGKSKPETLVIGDSVHDLGMANAAGVASIGVTSGANEYDQLAEHKPLSILKNVAHFKAWCEAN